MNIEKFGRGAVIVMALLATACASTRTQKSAGEQFDDTVTTGRVKAALIADPVTKAHQIDVEVFRGVVQLNGFVDSTVNRDRATTVARGVNGVHEVRNNLRVQASDRTAGEAVDDTAITARVKAALAADERTKAHQINIETRAGVVQLSGFVDNAAVKAAAGDIAGRVQNVSRVDNQLDIKTR